MGRGRGDRSQDPQFPGRWETPDSQPKEAFVALEASQMGLEEPSLGAVDTAAGCPRSLQWVGAGGKEGQQLYSRVNVREGNGSPAKTPSPDMTPETP